jgi:hypothetical protein
MISMTATTYEKAEVSRVNVIYKQDFSGARL